MYLYFISLEIKILDITPFYLYKFVQFWSAS